MLINSFSHTSVAYSWFRLQCATYNLSTLQIIFSEQNFNEIFTLSSAFAEISERFLITTNYTRRRILYTVLYVINRYTVTRIANVIILQRIPIITE